MQGRYEGSLRSPPVDLPLRFGRAAVFLAGASGLLARLEPRGTELNEARSRFHHPAPVPSHWRWVAPEVEPPGAAAGSRRCARDWAGPRRRHRRAPTGVKSLVVVVVPRTTRWSCRESTRGSERDTPAYTQDRMAVRLKHAPCCTRGRWRSSTGTPVHPLFACAARRRRGAAATH